MEFSNNLARPLGTSNRFPVPQGKIDLERDYVER